MVKRTRTTEINGILNMPHVRQVVDGQETGEEFDIIMELDQFNGANVTVTITEVEEERNDAPGQE